jgi:hypothetical protein
MVEGDEAPSSFKEPRALDQQANHHPKHAKPVAAMQANAFPLSSD